MPFIDLDRNAAETGNSIDQIKGAAVLNQFPDLADRIADAGRGFGMDDRYNFIRILRQEFTDSFGPDRRPPFKLFLGDFRAQAGSHVRHAVPEYAVFQDQDLVAGFNRIDKSGFHSRGSRPGERYRHFVPGLEQFAKAAFNVFHNPDKIGIQMSEKCLGERAVSGRRDSGRACAQKQRVLNVVKIVFLHLSELLY